MTGYNSLGGASKDKIAIGAMNDANQKALDVEVELRALRIGLRAKNGTTLTTLDDQVLVGGVYKLSGDISMADTLTLLGDENTEFVFNIDGSLGAMPELVIQLNKTYDASGSIVAKNTPNSFKANVKPSNIFWNVEEAAIITSSKEFTGVVLSGLGIIYDGVKQRPLALLSESDIFFQTTNNFTTSAFHSSQAMEELFDDEYAPNSVVVPIANDCSTGLTNMLFVNDFAGTPFPFVSFEYDIDNDGTPDFPPFTSTGPYNNLDFSAFGEGVFYGQTIINTIFGFPLASPTEFIISGCQDNAGKKSNIVFGYGDGTNIISDGGGLNFSNLQDGSPTVSNSSYGSSSDYNYVINPFQRDERQEKSSSAYVSGTDGTPYFYTDGIAIYDPNQVKLDAVKFPVNTGSQPLFTSDGIQAIHVSSNGNAHKYIVVASNNTNDEQLVTAIEVVDNAGTLTYNNFDYDITGDNVAEISPVWQVLQLNGQTVESREFKAVTNTSACSDDKMLLLHAKTDNLPSYNANDIVASAF